MRCPKCGHENPEGSRFCQSCGASLPAEVIPEAPGSAEAASPEAVEKQERPVWLRTVGALLRVLLYVGLFFGCQSCVISGYTARQMLAAGVPASDEMLTTDYTQRLLEGVSGNMTMILLVSNLLTILLICLIGRLRGRNPREELGVYHVNPLRLPLFALFGVSLNLFLSLLLPLLPIPEGLMELQETQYGSLYGGNLLLELLSVGLVAGITEELVFRGIAMSRLRTGGAAFAVIVSALIFGFAHGTPVAAGYAFVLGLLFAGLYLRFGSVVPGMVCHVFFNMSNYWIPESESAFLPLMALSAVGIVLCVVLFYLRRPSFLDAVNDLAERMNLSPEERSLVRRFRESQREGALDFEQASAFEEEWRKLGEAGKKERKEKKK